MRKIKVLFSMALVAVMLCTVAFASAGVVFTPVEYDGAADTITVELKANEAITIDSFSSIWMSFDTSILEYVSATTEAANATVSDQSEFGYVEFENSAGDSAVTSDMCLIKAVFKVIDKANIENAEFGIADGCFASYAGGAEILDLTSKMTITKKTAPTGPSFDASGKATKGTIKGHDIVGGGRTEDRTYFADQFTLTNTTAETTIYGIKTTFVPVYASGADNNKAVVKTYDIPSAEGIKGGAELKFNVVLIGTPAEVIGVNISSEIVTAK